MAPVVGVNHALTTVFPTTTVSPPISAPVSSLIPAVEMQLGSETPPTVSNDAALMIVVANHSFSIWLRSAVVHYRPLLLI